MSFDVVRATFDHLELLVPLFDGYRQFYQKPSDLEGARQFLHDRLANNESVIFLALRNDTGLGFTQLYPSFSSVSMKRLWVLNDLFVSSQVRKQGVAQALMERARQHAVETGAKGLMLQTAVDNFPAQRLYESLGWVRDNDFYVYDLTF